MREPGSQLRDRVALVTGGSRGLGAATCLALSEAGALVVLNYAQNVDAAKDTESRIRVKGGRVSLLAGDVSREPDVSAMFRTIEETFGRLDILVNNAGVNSDFIVEEMNVAEWDRIMAVNLRGSFLCAKHAIPLMRKARYGRIINLSSQGVRKGSIAHAHYAASKMGLIGFTRSLARELGRDGITVNAVSPGRIMTDMLMSNLAHEGKEEEWIRQTPLGRFGEPGEVAEAIVFLASERASYITGQILAVDGGLLMQ